MTEYNTTHQPPAPILEVTVSNPYNPEVDGIPKEALIDSGAFMTAIPEDFIDKLRIFPAGEVSTRGYKEGEQTHRTYFVDVSFNGFSFPNTEVMAVKRKNVLIGRDILNQLKLILDGKNLNFDILDP
jgi:predicted aspartyl protease